MTYEELKVDTIYTYNDNSEYKVLYKHDESKVVLIQNLENGYTLVWGETFIKNFKPKVKPLPETGLLRWSKGSLVFRTGEAIGYGFDSYGKFGASFFCKFDNDWRKATKEDFARFKELVIEHLKSLGFKNRDSFVSLFTWGNCTINFDSGVGFDDCGIYLGNNYVYLNNEWIQPISAKEVKTEKEKVKSILDQMKDLLDSM